MPKETENKLKDLVNRRSTLQGIMDGVEKLRQIIAHLEADRKVLDQENSEITRQPQESKSRLQMLSREQGRESLHLRRRRWRI